MPGLTPEIQAWGDNCSYTVYSHFRVRKQRLRSYTGFRTLACCPCYPCKLLFLPEMGPSRLKPGRTTGCDPQSRWWVCLPEHQALPLAQEFPSGCRMASSWALWLLFCSLGILPHHQARNLEAWNEGFLCEVQWPHLREAGETGHYDPSGLPSQHRPGKQRMVIWGTSFGVRQTPRCL